MGASWANVPMVTGLGAQGCSPALSRSRNAVPAVGQLPLLRHACRALRLPRAPLHGHRAAQRAHDLGRLPRGQVGHGTAAGLGPEIPIPGDVEEPVAKP